MTRIDSIWQELESNLHFSSGLLLRRYSSEIQPDLFIAIQAQQKVRCIGISIDKSIVIDLDLYDDLEDLNIELVSDPTSRSKNLLLLKIIDNRHHDIFSVLCEDLISSVSSINNEKALVKELFNRLGKWKLLFQRAASEGLSPQEQRGLFGELFFIRKLICRYASYLKVIATWVGPEKNIQDFQLSRWSVEVKTTHGNNHQKVHISNERQLDISNIESLFLYHLSLHSLQNAGETLNDIVVSICNILSADIEALNRFKNKLLEAGYFDHHKHYYDSHGYEIRKENIYKVAGAFPRIEEKDLKDGVGDVKYTIILSQCSSYQVSEDEMYQTLNFL